MPCKTEFESAKSFRDFLKQADKSQVDDAISWIIRMKNSQLAARNRATAERFEKLYDMALATYPKKFGEEWVPF